MIFFRRQKKQFLHDYFFISLKNDPFPIKRKKRIVVPIPLSSTAEHLLLKTKHFLITEMGKVESEASDEEFYRAFSLALREEIMLHWLASLKSFDHKKMRTLYFLSMEYLPGKLLSSAITNTDTIELFKAILAKTNRSISDILTFDAEPGLGNGGLGRLVSCYLDSLATHHYPAWGYGLRYQYGIFDQEIWNGVQVERPDCWLLSEYPWEWRKDAHAQSIYYRGRAVPATNSHGDEIFHLEDYEEVLALPYDVPIVGYAPLKQDFSVLTLRLWSTKESPKNFELQRYNAGQLDQASENTSLTDVLYPNDNHETGKRIRLKQEFLLTAASLQDIMAHHLRVYGDLSSFGDKVQIQINDTHPAMIIAELMRRLISHHDIPWKTAWEITQSACNYTNHTMLKESLEEWNEKRVAYLLPRQYKIIQKLNEDFCNKVRKRFPNDEGKVQRMSFIENGQIRMAHLAIVGSKKVNGVSALHTELLKKSIFSDFSEMFPEKFLSITNGVTQRRWLLHCNPKLSRFISDRIGNEWIHDFSQIQKLQDFANDPKSQQEFLEIKNQNKKAFFHFLATENPIRDFNGKIINHSSFLSEALVDVHIKRFHEYKRQLLNALHLIMLLHELEKNPQERKVKRMVIIGGKAAPGYEMAKITIRLINCIARKINSDPSVSKSLQVAFVENYNVSKAEIIIPAADLSQQISTAGMEASGTGNMKLAMNGALTIGTEDGANIEMKQAVTDSWWPFSFGLKASEIEKHRSAKTNPAWEIYLANEAIKRAVDALKDGSLAKTEQEHQALHRLYDQLLDGYQKENADPFFVLADLPSYYATQKKVEELYATPLKWAEVALHNIAAMGNFSSDRSIQNYVDSVWHVQKCMIDPEILKKVKEEFEEHSLYS
jgi:glycogen phosphorylase